MELMFEKASKILGWIGIFVLTIEILFTIEVAFIASLLSLALWIVEYNGDLASISLIIKIHSYLLQFAIVMLIFAMLMRAFKRYTRYCKEKRDRNQQTWKEDLQKFLDEVKNAVKNDEVQIYWIDLTRLADETKISWHKRKRAENAHFQKYHEMKLKAFKKLRGKKK